MPPPSTRFDIGNHSPKPSRLMPEKRVGFVMGCVIESPATITMRNQFFLTKGLQVLYNFLRGSPFKLEKSGDVFRRRTRQSSSLGSRKAAPCQLRRKKSPLFQNLGGGG